MQSDRELREQLRNIDHKSYPQYKSLKGSYRFPKYILHIDHVQGDPFAAPSDVRVTIDATKAGFPDFAMKDGLTRDRLADLLVREFARQVNAFSFKAKGSGKSGLISVSHPGQEVLRRTACQVRTNEIIVRFSIGFPANGRTINARELDKILFDFLPVCVEKALYYENLDATRIKEAIDLAEDQRAIRQQLKEKGLVAFVANGSILPRESGISSRPMKGAKAFVSPESLQVTLDLPHKGKFKGMGVKPGNHPDRRWRLSRQVHSVKCFGTWCLRSYCRRWQRVCHCRCTALKLCAEDGRFIKNVDISMFINDLPNGRDTHVFLQKTPAAVHPRRQES